MKILIKGAGGFIYRDRVQDVSRGLKTVAQGASTTIWCATSPLLKDIGGMYCEDNDIVRLDLQREPVVFSEATLLNGVMPYALDNYAASKLWRLSEQLTELKFNLSTEKHF